MTACLDDDALAAHPLPVLPDDGDKEDRGAVLVVGGETTMIGAVVLAGVSALRVGAGKLQVRTDSACAAVVAATLPEARVLVAAPNSAGPLLRSAAAASSLVLGPGMETGPGARRLARRLLGHALLCPAVVDAGALPIDAEAARFAGIARGRAVLTPHAGEMAAMLGREKQTIKADPLSAGRDAAAKFQSVVVMKGAVTFVISPDGTAWRHDGGVTGLATSGSGDVLAGAIGGLLARGAPPVGAALWGVALHAAAGAALADAGAPLGFLARELPAQLPPIMARICDRIDRSARP